MWQNIQKKKAGRWREGKGRGLVKEKVAVETSLRRTLDQRNTNQEDTYGKSILQDNDSSSQVKMEIYLKSKELQRKPCAGGGWDRADIKIGGVLWET